MNLGNVWNGKSAKKISYSVGCSKPNTMYIACEVGYSSTRITCNSKLEDADKLICYLAFCHNNDIYLFLIILWWKAV